MIYFEDYLISVIYLSDGAFLSNSLFSLKGEGHFNFYKEISSPFKGLKLMERHSMRDTKKISTREEITIEEKVISAIPWPQIVRLDFGEIERLDKDVLRLLGIEEEETVDLDVV